MKPRPIHQFHSGSAYGDAVTNGMLLIRQFLTQAGIPSKIYVEQVAPELKGELHPHHELSPATYDITLIHHSMGHDLEQWVLDLPGKKILVYHNITPTHFFTQNSPLHHYADLGRQQLKRFRPTMHAAIADSQINAAELKALGYTDITVLPLLVDTSAMQNQKWDTTIANSAADKFTILFVGRMAPNKCQHDLIAMASHVKQMLAHPFELVLVGGFEQTDPYYQELQRQIRQNRLHPYVRFTGKISDEQLYGWYRAADLFISMSEHEGFGVPLIEAMAFDLPVMAYKSSNIPHTLSGAGILLTRKDPVETAALVKLIATDRALQRAIVTRQRKRVDDFQGQRLCREFYRFLSRHNNGLSLSVKEFPSHDHTDPLYQIEGPFETSYSLALVNRELALALERQTPGSVGIFATEGHGDYEADASAVAAFPGLSPLWKAGEKNTRAEIVIRNLYPPRVSDMGGLTRLFYFAWEESMLPERWVSRFNHHLDGLPVLSTFIQKILIDNGVVLPSVAAGCGIDHLRKIFPVPFPLALKTRFKFLHVSSCFPRKGVDLLLKAFAENFTSEDDAGLVIKTFPNIHNTIEHQVAALQKKYPQCPPIEIISQDLKPGEIIDLYQRCHALVAPSRGEGFGLPMAEAMFLNLPVITTAYGGQSDFCTPETCWPIDFSFAPAQTHMGLFDSVWMEPDVHHLGKLMKTVYRMSEKERKPRLEAAKELVEKNFTWQACAERMQGLARQIRQISPLSRRPLPRIGWISSWNCRCGIATYSTFLIQDTILADMDIRIFASTTETPLSPDPPHVIRCWTDHGGNVDELLAALVQHEIKVVVLQFNFAFFSPANLGRILRFTRKHNMLSIVFFHATADVDLPEMKASLAPVAQDLALAHRLLVHGINDLNRLKSLGLYTHTALFPHGVRKPELPDSVAAPHTREKGRCILATYGFLLPHKGLEEMIRSVAILKKKYPELILKMINARYPGEISRTTEQRCRELILKLNLTDSVTLTTDFLPDEAALKQLASADMILFPYQKTAESASGAVRFGLTSGRPVVCTPLDIFSDVREIVHLLPGTTPEEIARGISSLLEDATAFAIDLPKRKQWLAVHDWKILAKRLHGMIQGLLT